MADYYLKLPENSYPKSCKNCWIPCGFAELGSAKNCPFIFTEDEMKKKLLTDLSDIKIIYKNIQFTPEELGLINKTICNLSPNTVDAVPVVRCRDCKHRAMEEPGMVYCKNIVGSWVSDDFYCADAERRTE